MKRLLFAILMVISQLGISQLELGCSSDDSLHFSCFPGLKSIPTQDSLLIIPSTHSFQILVSEGDPLSGGGGFVGGYNDFSGYLGKGGSSRNGYLLVNHELAVGSVTLSEIHYDSISRLWESTPSKLIDFSDSSLMGTSRPCSGQVSSWGTFFVGEEVVDPSPDLNSDGYDDYGWLIEIDPDSAKVVDHDGDGSPDKLWSLGAMAHENIAFANDSVAYFDADEALGLLFKFVADVPKNFSSGSLYALRIGSLPSLNGLTTIPPTMGVWKPIPNSTPSECNLVLSSAVSLGATNFMYPEDVEIHPLSGQVYFTSKYTTAPGAVYRFTDEGDSVKNFEVYVKNDYNYTVEHEGGIQTDAHFIAGADNLCFDKKGNLYLLQDGDRSHIWFIRNDHAQGDSDRVSIFMRTPIGSEPTGLTFSPDNQFAFVSIQHPTIGTQQVDCKGDTAVWNKSITVVIARKELLGNELHPELELVCSDSSILPGDTINFGVNVLSSSSDTLVNIINNGSDNLLVDFILLEGDPQFTLSADSMSLLNSMDTTSYILSLNASSAGTISAKISIISNDSINAFVHYVAAQIIDDAGLIEPDHSERIYPNPARDLLRVYCKTDAEYAIISVDGQLVQNGSLKSGLNSISLSGLAAGSYLIKLNTSERQYTQQFVVRN